MKKIENLGIVLFPSPRSRAYLQAFEAAKVSPSFCILIDSDFTFEKLTDNTKIDYFDYNKTEIESIENLGVDYRIISAKDINDKSLVSVLEESPQDFFIYTGGGIISQETLKAKKFVHVHSGDLPDYRGSTTFYYSILNDSNIVCSVILMNSKIDEGEIILKDYFKVERKYNLDLVYEPYLRSVSICNFVKIFSSSNGNLIPILDNKGGEKYFIIHPILKHISILKTI